MYGYGGGLRRDRAEFVVRDEALLFDVVCSDSGCFLRGFDGAVLVLPAALVVLYRCRRFLERLGLFSILY